MKEIQFKKWTIKKGILFWNLKYKTWLQYKSIKMKMTNNLAQAKSNAIKFKILIFDLLYIIN